MKRTVYVARTSHDLKHVNRLVTPEYGVVSLNVVAGSASSKSHLPADAPQPKTADAGSDDFHFVPEHEKVEIRYEIDNRFGLVDGAKLEMFARFQETPLWTLDMKTLGADWWAHGKHAVTWDGRIVKATAEQKGTAKGSSMTHDLTALALDQSLAPFPDGYFTLEHTPYKLKLTVTGDPETRANPVAAWTFFHILVKKIELELGPVEAIPTNGVSATRQAVDKALHKTVKDAGGLPASGAPAARKVFLISNIYKTASAEMNDNTAFTLYQTMWDDGSKIPVVAKVRLLASNDTEVKLEDGPGAKALGNVKFLWDWEDTDGTQADAHQSQAAPKAFLKKAIDYYRDGTDATRAGQDHTYPKGSNCHKDRDSKRGPGAVRVFPDGPGYATQKVALDEDIFPFKVAVCDTRKWASFSYAWTKGKMIGQTGVLFSPRTNGGRQLQDRRLSCL